jgi:hypothetical protein
VAAAFKTFLMEEGAALLNKMAGLHAARGNIGKK